MGRRWIDRGLVAAALLLGAVIVAGALSSRGHHGSKAEPSATVVAKEQHVVVLQQAPPDTPLPDSVVALRSSPETAYLPPCSLRRLELDVRRGQRLVVRYDGPPCSVPKLDLTAIVRDGHGHVVARRPALDPDTLPAVLAGRQSASTDLAPGILRCWAGKPFGLRAVAHGRAIRGTVRCRTQR